MDKTKKSGCLLIAVGVVLLLASLVGWKKEVRCSGCTNTTQVVWYSDNEKNFCDECMERFKSIFGK